MLHEVRIGVSYDFKIMCSKHVCGNIPMLLRSMGTNRTGDAEKEELNIYEKEQKKR